MNAELIIGIIGIAAAIFFFWIGFSARKQAQRVDSGGVDGEATIISRKIEGTPRSRTLNVTFQFEAARADGEKVTYTHEEEVNRDHYRLLTEQSKATIRYLPADPAGSARLSGSYQDSTASIIPFAIGAGFLIGAIFIIGITLNVGGQTSAQGNTAATLLAIGSPDLSAIETALNPQIAQWENVTDQNAHFVSSASVGLSNVTQEQIVYGYCPDKTFYIYVPERFQEGNAPNVHASEAYTFYSTPDNFCFPSGWIATPKGDLGGGWSLSTVVRIDPTALPGSTEESIPTTTISG